MRRQELTEEQRRKRAEAAAQLELEKSTGGSTASQVRGTTQIGSGKAYDPAARAANQPDTKAQKLFGMLASDNPGGRFRDLPEISKQRERAGAYRDTSNANMAALRKEEARMAEARKKYKPWTPKSERGK